MRGGRTVQIAVSLAVIGLLVPFLVRGVRRTNEMREIDAELSRAEELLSRGEAREAVCVASTQQELLFGRKGGKAAKLTGWAEELRADAIEEMVQPAAAAIVEELMKGALDAARVDEVSGRLSRDRTSCLSADELDDFQLQVADSAKTVYERGASSALAAGHLSEATRLLRVRALHSGMDTVDAELSRTYVDAALAGARRPDDPYPAFESLSSILLEKLALTLAAR